VFGEVDEAGKTQAGDLLHTLKHDGDESAWEILTRWRAALAGGMPKTPQPPPH
jgi:hypothetical protein